MRQNTLKKILTDNECKLQLVEPHNHRVNAAERAIQTFKDAFIVALATTDSNFHSNCGTESLCKFKTPSTWCAHQESTQTYWHTRHSTARMTGIDILLHPWGARPLYTKMVIPEDHGHHGALMGGTLAHQRTTTNGPSITSLKPGCIAFRINRTLSATLPIT